MPLPALPHLVTNVPHGSVVVVVVVSVVVVVVSPQFGGTGFDAALHVALPALNAEVHAERQALPGLRLGQAALHVLTSVVSSLLQNYYALFTIKGVVRISVCLFDFRRVTISPHYLP